MHRLWDGARGIVRRWLAVVALAAPSVVLAQGGPGGGLPPTMHVCFIAAGQMEPTHSPYMFVPNGKYYIGKHPTSEGQAWTDARDACTAGESIGNKGCNSTGSVSGNPVCRQMDTNRAMSLGATMTIPVKPAVDQSWCIAFGLTPQGQTPARQWSGTFHHTVNNDYVAAQNAVKAQCSANTCEQLWCGRRPVSYGSGASSSSSSSGSGSSSSSSSSSGSSGSSSSATIVSNLQTCGYRGVRTIGSDKAPTGNIYMSRNVDPAVALAQAQGTCAANEGGAGNCEVIHCRYTDAAVASKAAPTMNANVTPPVTAGQTYCEFRAGRTAAGRQGGSYFYVNDNIYGAAHANYGDAQDLARQKCIRGEGNAQACEMSLCRTISAQVTTTSQSGQTGQSGQGGQAVNKVQGCYMLGGQLEPTHSPNTFIPNGNVYFAKHASDWQQAQLAVRNLCQQAEPKGGNGCFSGQHTGVWPVCRLMDEAVANRVPSSFKLPIQPQVNQSVCLAMERTTLGGDTVWTGNFRYNINNDYLAAERTVKGLCANGTCDPERCVTRPVSYTSQNTGQQNQTNPFGQQNQTNPFGQTNQNVGQTGFSGGAGGFFNKYQYYWRQVGGNWRSAPVLTGGQFCAFTPQHVCNQPYQKSYAAGMMIPFFKDGCGQPTIQIQCVVELAGAKPGAQQPTQQPWVQSNPAQNSPQYIKRAKFCHDYADHQKNIAVKMDSQNCANKNTTHDNWQGHKDWCHLQPDARVKNAMAGYRQALNACNTPPAPQGNSFQALKHQECTDFTNFAMDINARYQARNCPKVPVMHANRTGHYNWCMSKPPLTVQGDRNAKQAAMDRCAAGPAPAGGGGGGGGNVVNTAGRYPPGERVTGKSGEWEIREHIRPDGSFERGSITFNRYAPGNIWRFSLRDDRKNILTVNTHPSAKKGKVKIRYSVNRKYFDGVADVGPVRTGIDVTATANDFATASDGTIPVYDRTYKIFMYGMPDAMNALKACRAKFP